MANQFKHANETAREQRDFVAFDLCEVVEVVPNSSGSVRIRPFSTSDASETPFIATYLVDEYGDINQPETGDICVVGYTRSSDPIILGFFYGNQGGQASAHEIDERVIGHRQSTASIRFKSDGTVVVENDGTKVEVASDGDVIVNDGTAPVVTDVAAASRNSNNGITSLDVTYSDSLYVP